MSPETDPPGDTTGTPPDESLPKNESRAEEPDAEIVQEAGEKAVGETVELSHEAEDIVSEEREPEDKPEPIGHSLSGKPVYEILGEETSPEGEKFVKIKTVAPGRLPNGEPDWKNVSFGETVVPLDDIPVDLLEKSNSSADEETPPEREEVTSEAAHDGHISEPDADVSDEIKALAEKYGIPAKFFQEAEHDPFKADVLRRKGINWGAEHSVIDPGAKRALRPVTAAELDTVNESRGTKVTPENLRFAELEANRGNLRPADRLQGLGLDLGISRLDPADPVVVNSEVGRRRLEEVESLVKRIEENPQELRATLRRPGEMPMGLHHVPLARELGMRITAWRIARKEIHDRAPDLARARQQIEELDGRKAAGETLSDPENKKLDNLRGEIKELQGPHDDGRLRLGLPRYVLYRNYIRRLDESVKSHRRDLFILDRHSLQGPEAQTKRENLAYRIFDGQASVRWLDDLRIVDKDNPEAMHNHGRFKEKSKEFHRILDEQQGR